MTLVLFHIFGLASYLRSCFIKSEDQTVSLSVLQQTGNDKQENQTMNWFPGSTGRFWRTSSIIISGSTSNLTDFLGVSLRKYVQPDGLPHRFPREVRIARRKILFVFRFYTTFIWIFELIPLYFSSSVWYIRIGLYIIRAGTPVFYSSKGKQRRTSRQQRRMSRKQRKTLKAKKPKKPKEEMKWKHEISLNVRLSEIERDWMNLNEIERDWTRLNELEWDWARLSEIEWRLNED